MPEMEWACWMCNPGEYLGQTEIQVKTVECREHGPVLHVLIEVPLESDESGGVRTATTAWDLSMMKTRMEYLPPWFESVGDRPSMKRVNMNMLRVLKYRSTCPPGRQHAAMIVRDDRVVSMGYNGPPRGWSAPGACLMGCDEYGKDFRRCPCIHAEVNAIINAARAGVTILCADMFVTKKPCSACALMIENCGLEAVYYLED